jgi:hypothetical protein
MDHRKKFSFEGDWPAIEKIYNHSYSDLTPHYNLIYIMGQTLIPSLVFQAPGVINTPMRSGMTQWASLFDGLDNWWVNHCDMKGVLQEGVLSAYLTNTVSVGIGYDFGDPLEQDLVELQGASNRTRATNAAWLDRIPTHRLLLAPGTTTMTSCPWAAKFVSVPTKILKGRKGLKNVTSSKVPDEIKKHEAELWEFRDADTYTCFWEIHDSTTKKWCWLSTNGKFILPWTEDPLQVHGLPFSVESLNKNTKSLFGSCDPRYIMSQHLEGDDCRFQGLKQRRLAVSKFLFKSGAIDSETMGRLLSVDSPAGIPVDIEMDKSIRDSVLELKGTVDFGVLEYQKFLKQDAQELLGHGPNQMGTFAPGRRSAKEAGIVEGNANSRLDFRRSRIANLAEDLVIKANRLMSENWSGELVQQIVGADGALYWVEADPKKLREMGFGMETRVNVESMAPVSRERRKAEAQNLLQQLSAMGEAGANTLPILTQLLSQFEWIDVRQVLPQSAQRYSMEAFQQKQEELMSQGGLGETAANNVQGVNSLINRLPAEPIITDNGDNNESR